MYMLSVKGIKMPLHYSKNNILDSLSNTNSETNIIIQNSFSV